ncbi:MAG: hypothetical protein PWQ06_144 [Anaerophaga sp.]|uniref:DUF4861 family protein n=1 Tax=Anaerophaga thermohalophila TaxID=177400 RepID=UPI000237CBE6|nr:DUF4861 family protein [Anaerophaga thermohalophila]MDI3521663.1 hypothetical protein [Anaerophaga sp.]MDN5289905.1 hypothetical protein [Anaerophaga sp.]
MKNSIFTLMLFVSLGVVAQNQTDVSLMWKDSEKQESVIISETGDLYNKVKHHGPAIENEWLALRLYFDHKVAIDVYNKTRPGLELAEAEWYPTEEQQKQGWGADQYKVGSTVGLGGVRLWNPETQEEMFLNPVSRRIARVKKEPGISYMEMLSEGIPYMGDTIDVLVRVTVFSGHREAKVEAFALSCKPVYFFTGINYHETTKTRQADNYICTWGIHPEDVAAFQLNIGGAIIFNPDDFESITKAPKQFELISKPTKYISTWITSACERESELNNMDAFVKYLNGLSLN